jgi:hypothetical protein
MDKSIAPFGKVHDELGVVLPERRITIGVLSTTKEAEDKQVKPKVAVTVYVPAGSEVRSSVSAPLDHTKE